MVVIALLVFRDSLRFSVRQTILLTIGLCVIKILETFWTNDDSLIAAIVSVSSVVVYFVFFFAAVETHVLKLLMVVLLLMNYGTITSVTSSFLMSLFAPEFRGKPYSWVFLAFYSLSLLLAAPVCYRTLDRCVTPCGPAEAEGRIWRCMWVMPASFCAVYYYCIYFSGDGLHPFSSSWFNVLFFWTLNFFSLLSADMMVQVLEETRKNHLLQLECSQNALKMEQYEVLKQNMKQTRRARHDLRQHLQAIQGCISSRDWDALDIYMKGYSESLPPEILRTFCKNTAVDAVMRHYAEKAAQSGIQTEIIFLTGETTIIPEPELCVLLGNLMENAVEASASAEGGFIKVRATQTTGNMFFLTIDNSSPTPPVWEKGHLCSGKHDGFGIGTDSVRIIAERYNGDARFEWENNIFRVSVLLNP